MIAFLRRNRVVALACLLLAVSQGPALADCQDECLAACPKRSGAFGSQQVDTACATRCLNLVCEQQPRARPGVPPIATPVPVPQKQDEIELVVTGATPLRALSRGTFALTAAALPRGGRFTWRLTTPGAVDLVDEHKPSHGIFTLPQHGPSDAEASERRVVPQKVGRVEIAVDYAVGTKTASKTVRFDLLPPILFLHGIASNAEVWNPMKRRLEEAGLLFGGKFCATCGAVRDGDFYTADFPHPQDSYIRQQTDVAAWTAAIVSHIPAATRPDARKVALVAHSQGGLAARAYLQSPAYRGDVSALVTIGTPHRGSIAGQFAHPVLTRGTPPPYMSEDIYRDYWMPLLETTERPVKAILQWVVRTYGNGGMDFDSEGVRELAIVSDDMKALDRDVQRTLPRGLRYAFVVGTLPPEMAQEILSNRKVEALGWLERNNAVYTTLKRLLERTDVLVDEGSQNLNTLVPGLGPVVRTQAIHCCWPGGFRGRAINETEQTDVILRAMGTTGLFAGLAR